MQRLVAPVQRHVYTMQRPVVRVQRLIATVQRFVVPVQRHVYTVQRPVIPAPLSRFVEEAEGETTKNPRGVANTPQGFRYGPLQEWGVGADGDFTTASAAVEAISTGGGASGVEVALLARPRKTFRLNSASFGERGP